MHKSEKAIVLAEKVKLLFGFCADLIPDKIMLKDVLTLADDRVSTTMAMAPIIGAFGQDWEVMDFEARIKARRAKALFNLIDTLDETEEDMRIFKEKQKEKEKGRAQLARILGR